MSYLAATPNDRTLLRCFGDEGVLGRQAPLPEAVGAVALATGDAGDVEFATMTYVDWFHRRLHGEITNDATYATPAEFERSARTSTPNACSPRPSFAIRSRRQIDQ